MPYFLYVKGQTFSFSFFMDLQQKNGRTYSQTDASFSLLCVFQAGYMLVGFHFHILLGLHKEHEQEERTSTGRNQNNVSMHDAL